MFILQVLEIEEHGKPTGRYRLAAYNDGADPLPLCHCEGGHVTPDEARNCKCAKSWAKYI